MLYQNFTRSGGLASVLAGVLFVVWGYVHKENASASFDAISNALAIIVPLLFLLGLVGFYARCEGQIGWLGITGFALGCTGAAEGIARGATDWSFWYTYVAGRAWLSLLSDWLILLLAGLTLVGITTIGTKALRYWGTLFLAMGTFGWAYCLTDAGSAVETRPGHVAFGILFSLSWTMLGYALCRTTSTADLDITTRTR